MPVHLCLSVPCGRKVDKSVYIQNTIFKENSLYFSFFTGKYLLTVPSQRYIKNINVSYIKKLYHA